MNNLFCKKNYSSEAERVQLIIDSIKHEDSKITESLAETGIYGDFVVFVEEKEAQFITAIVPADFNSDTNNDDNTTSNRRHKVKLSLLHLAVLTKNPSKIGVLLLNGADVNEVTDDGVTPLTLACALNRPKSVIQALLHWDDVDVNASTSWGWTALHYAASNGNEQIIVMLMRQLADPYIRDFKGRSPLHLAVEKRSLGSVFELMRFGTDPTLVKRIDGATALHQAVAMGHWEIVEAMIERGADIGLVYRNGELDLDMFNLTKPEREMRHRMIEKFARKKGSWLTRILTGLKIFLFGSRSFDERFEKIDLDNL